MNRGLFIYHRDFRIGDNRGLLNAAKKCDKIYTCFVFTPEQVNRNSYKSKNTVEFMIESLSELQSEIRSNGGDLIILYDTTVNALSMLIDELKIDGVFFNADYTPYAKKRTADVEDLCNNKGIECETSQDYYIHKPGTIVNGSGNVYVRFTSFYESYFFKHEFDLPETTRVTNFSKTSKKFKTEISLQDAIERFVGSTNPDLAVHGGRVLGLKVLLDASKRLKDYNETRDTMSEQTSMLSAYIKYGCVSIREVVKRFRVKYSSHHEFIRQLIWRDFYMHLLSEHPYALGNLTNDKMRKAKWSTSKNRLEKWKKGETGFPLVDAGMRQMNATGYMHNRARMIVATFLSKILYLDWREGEKYFAQKLVDYDVASNSGNWQAIVGGGLYSMPWFRILSPWAQSEKNDKDLEYILKWVPELGDVEPKHVHKWYKYHKKYPEVRYPKPMVDFDKKRDDYMENMKDIMSR